MNMFELNTKVCPIRAVSLLLYLAVDEMAGLYGQTEIQTLRQGAAFVKVGHVKAPLHPPIRWTVKLRELRADKKKAEVEVPLIRSFALDFRLSPDFFLSPDTCLLSLAPTGRPIGLFTGQVS